MKIKRIQSTVELHSTFFSSEMIRNTRDAGVKADGPGKDEIRRSRRKQTIYWSKKTILVKVGKIARFDQDGLLLVEIRIVCFQSKKGSSAFVRSSGFTH